MLTTEQSAVLKAAISADPTASAFALVGDDIALAEWLNAPTPFIVWRTDVHQDEIMQNGFDWVQVDNLTVGKARIWEWLFANDQRVINAAKANVRAGIGECWKGTAAMLAVRDAVYAHCRRAATKAESLLATGTGTTAIPGTMTFEGNIHFSEASTLR